MDLTMQELTDKINALEIGQRLVLSSVPEAMYHHAPGIGSTLLKAATVSMAHYRARRDHIESYTAGQLKAFRIGSATHCLVLEPELYDEKVVTQPAEIKIRQGKVWKAFEEANIGKEILTPAEEKQVGAMSDAIFEGAGLFFVKGQSEVSYWYRHPSGLILKARADYVQDDALIDLKTNRADCGRKFAQAVKYDYDIQDSLYRMVTELADMIYIGVGKTEPYSVFMAKQGREIRVRAEGQIERTLQAIKLAEEFGEYPGLPVELIETEFTEFERNKAA